MPKPVATDIEARKSALVRGALLVVAAMGAGTLLLIAAGRLGWLAAPGAARPVSSIIVVAALAVLAMGVRTLWREAFARRFDGVGLVALALTLSATLSLALFIAILALIWLGGSWLE